jgi:hypothetical protein
MITGPDDVTTAVLAEIERTTNPRVSGGLRAGRLTRFACG